MSDALDRSLAEFDAEVAEAMVAEWRRQRGTLEMTASENFAPLAVLQAQGAAFTNQYADGYPERHGGGDHVDVVERLAIDRARGLFGAEYANVQPHSGSLANAAAMFALLDPGDTILGFEPAHERHLTHQMRNNLSGKLYNAVSYHLRESDLRVDMAEVERLALVHWPQLIVAGWSAYPRRLDFPEFRRIADLVGAYLMVDIGHLAGLVAAGLYPNPVPYADVVTTATRGTLGGPPGGVVLTNREDLAKKVNTAVFPGLPGGPLEHVIAAKAVSFKIASSEQFRDRQQRTLSGAKILAGRLMADDVRQAGISVATDGTDVHLVLVDLRDSAQDGQLAEERLHDVGITVNRNAVPLDPCPPILDPGLLIGTPALATRGLGDEAFREVADIIVAVLCGPMTDEPAGNLRSRVRALTAGYPLYPELSKVSA